MLCQTSMFAKSAKILLAHASHIAKPRVRDMEIVLFEKNHEATGHRMKMQGDG